MWTIRDSQPTTRERFGIRRRHARKLLFSSLNFSQSSRMYTVVGLSTTPNTRVWRSSLLTRIDSVSVFSRGGYLDPWSKVWVGISSKSPIRFRSNSRISRGTPLCTSWVILKNIVQAVWGGNLPKHKTLKSITSWTVEDFTSIYVWQTLLVDFYGPHELKKFPVNIVFLGNFQKCDTQNVPKLVNHFQGAHWNESIQNFG